MKRLKKKRMILILKNLFVQQPMLKLFLTLMSGIYRKKTSLKDAEDKQLEMTILLKKAKKVQSR